MLVRAMLISAEARPLLGRRSMHQFIETFYDNSLNNMGNHDSFFWYGPR